MSLTTAKIGRCGELLVQYELLRLGIESAPMTTDAGVDLVAYAPEMPRPVTIQVKTNLRPKPGGGKGKSALDWWIPEDGPAELIALVDLSTRCIWLMKAQEVPQLAQQHPKGRYHLYMATDPTHKPKRARLSGVDEFAPYLLQTRVHELFGAQHFR